MLDGICSPRMSECFFPRRGELLGELPSFAQVRIGAQVIVFFQCPSMKLSTGTFRQKNKSSFETRQSPGRAKLFLPSLIPPLVVVSIPEGLEKFGFL